MEEIAGANAPELSRYLSPTAGALVSVRCDGTTFIRGIASGWLLLSRKRPEKPLAEWRAAKLAHIAGLPTWAQQVTTLPGLDELERWADDGIAESVTGARVEPDGYGPDGAPSWLLVLKLI